MLPIHSHNGPSLPWSSTSSYSNEHPGQETPQQLFEAVDSGDLVRVNALLSKNSVDLTAVDSCGDTPMHRAAARGSEEIVLMLWKHAKNDLTILDVTNQQGMTPMMVAAEKPCIPTMLALLLVGDSLGDENHAKTLEILSSEGHRLHESRVSLIKTLVKSCGHLALACDIALTNGDKKTAFFCMQERLRSFYESKENLSSLAGYKELLSTTENRIFDSFKAMLDAKNIGIDDLISLLNEVFENDVVNAKAKLCYLCGNSVFFKPILEYYAFSGCTQELSKLLRDVSSDSKEAAADVLVAIASNNVRSQAEKKSAMKIMADLLPAKIIDDLLNTFFQQKDKTSLKLMADSGLFFSTKNFVSEMVKAIDSRDKEMIVLLSDFGFNSHDIIEFNEKGKNNVIISSNAIYCLMLMILAGTPDLIDRDIKVKNISHWTRAGFLANKIIDKLMLDEMDGKNFENIKILIEANARSENLLIELCRQDRIEDARKVIGMQGAFGEALRKLKKSIDDSLDTEKMKLQQAVENDRKIKNRRLDLQKIDDLERGLNTTINATKEKLKLFLNVKSPTRKSKEDAASLDAQLKSAQVRLIDVMEEASSISESLVQLSLVGLDLKAEVADANKAAHDNQIVFNRLTIAIRTRDNSVSKV